MNDDYINCQVVDCHYQSSADMTKDGRDHCELQEIEMKIDPQTGLPVCQCFKLSRPLTSIRICKICKRPIEAEELMAISFKGKITHDKEEVINLYHKEYFHADCHDGSNKPFPARRRVIKIGGT